MRLRSGIPGMSFAYLTAFLLVVLVSSLLARNGMVCISSPVAYRMKGVQFDAVPVMEMGNRKLLRVVTPIRPLPPPPADHRL